VFTDIDDQRRAEDALRESEHHLRLLMETIPALVSRTTADGKLDYVNRRVFDYLGQEWRAVRVSRGLRPDTTYEGLCAGGAGGRVPRTGNSVNPDPP
jgi:PAS domain-containing protein